MTGLDKGEMFRDLSPDWPQAGARVAPAGKTNDYRPVIPVPPDAPNPNWRKLRPKEATGRSGEDLDLPYGGRRPCLLCGLVEAQGP